MLEGALQEIFLLSGGCGDCGHAIAPAPAPGPAPVPPPPGGYPETAGGGGFGGLTVDTHALGQVAKGAAYGVAAVGGFVLFTLTGGAATP
ncbi:hypothetical protein RGQ21_19790 [Kitasatospora aureofaciens]|nr:hypothetical protein RGQ21_19790 [Kitasatospora aureofaciens]